MGEFLPGGDLQGSPAAVAIRAGALSADAAGRAKIASAFFDSSTVTDKFASGSVSADRITPGTNDTVIGTVSSAIAEVAFTSAAATADTLAQRDANGDVIVPSTPTDNNAAASKSYVDANSSTTTGANGETMDRDFASTELTGLTGATATASSLIPAGALVFGVTIRVTSAVTGATDFDVGDGSDVDRWGAGIAVALDTTTSPTDFTDNTVQWQIGAAGDVVLTANGGSFSGGNVRISVGYLTLTPATS